jgi:hypothetical protein
MKRFYCRVCKQVKRVQKYPSNVISIETNNPTDRIGQCNHHEASFPAAIRQTLKNQRKVSA